MVEASLFSRRPLKLSLLRALLRDGIDTIRAATESRRMMQSNEKNFFKG